MRKTARKIQQQLEILLEKGSVAVMLTGGRSAEKLYVEWQKHPNFNKLSNVSFYFGDERCVSPEHLESNYAMAMQTLFKKGIPNNCVIHRIQAEKQDLNAVAEAYESLIPENIDILLLGIGEDGHVASLFPNSPQLHEQKRLCVPVIGPKAPYKRLTVTPPVIKNALITYILAAGESKKEIVDKVNRMEEDVDIIPAVMTKDPIWCFD